MAMLFQTIPKSVTIEYKLFSMGDSQWLRILYSGYNVFDKVENGGLGGRNGRCDVTVNMGVYDACHSQEDHVYACVRVLYCCCVAVTVLTKNMNTHIHTSQCSVSLCTGNFTCTL